MYTRRDKVAVCIQSRNNSITAVAHINRSTLQYYRIRARMERMAAAQTPDKKRIVMNKQTRKQAKKHAIKKRESQKLHGTLV